MRFNVIHIMSHPPPYKLYHDEQRPPINWDTSTGQWVGIWGYDWPDLLSNEILRLTSKYKIEVWQPDYRADKVYAYKFKTGLVHKLFPATIKKIRYGFKYKQYIVAHSIVNALRAQLQSNKVIINLHGQLSDFDAFILKKFYYLPIVYSNHSVIRTPKENLLRFRKNLLAAFHDIKRYQEYKRYIHYIDCVTYQNDVNLNLFKSLYKGKMVKVTMGCDFNFWKPDNKIFARNKLKLPLNQKIFLNATNFIERKQVDRLIMVFNRLANKYDFLLILAGHGEKEYENYLKNLGNTLLKQNKLMFVGYIRGEKLRTYYQASDYFVSVSKMEGGPVSVMQAFACEIPVICTKIGNTAELLSQYNAGCLLEINDYKEWEKKFEAILSNKLKVYPLNRFIAQQHYDWPNIARKFINIYDGLTKKYFDMENGQI